MPIDVHASSHPDTLSWVAQAPPVPPFRVPPVRAAFEQEQARLRAAFSQVLGNFPAHLPAPTVEHLSTTQHAGYQVERFRFNGGTGWFVPGVVYRPIGPGPFPAILWCHWHGGNYALGIGALTTTDYTPEPPGPTLARRGYVVLAIDAPGFGELNGQGPDRTAGSVGESSIAKYELLYGRSMWGLTIHHDRCALSILAARSDVDTTRIGTAGISMGCLRALWIAALDERIRATVAICCLVRLQDLITAQSMHFHGHYYYVPGILQIGDIETVIACIAPRALLSLNGADDPLTPLSGIRTTATLARPAWDLYAAGSRMRMDIIDGVGHAWNPAMWHDSLTWLDRHLEVTNE